MKMKIYLKPKERRIVYIAAFMTLLALFFAGPVWVNAYAFTPRAEIDMDDFNITDIQCLVFNETYFICGELEINETIDDRITVTFYNATVVNVTEGTYDSGATASTWLPEDGLYLNATEDAGANPLRIEANFTGVQGFVIVEIRGQYTGGSGHHLVLYLQECVGGTYVQQQGEITDESMFEYTVFTIRTATTYICGGNVSIRLDHEQNGNPGHTYSLDAILLIDGPILGTLGSLDHDSFPNRDTYCTNHPWVCMRFYNRSQVDSNTSDLWGNASGQFNLINIINSISPGLCPGGEFVDTPAGINSQCSPPSYTKVYTNESDLYLTGGTGTGTNQLGVNSSALNRTIDDRAGGGGAASFADSAIIDGGIKTRTNGSIYGGNFNVSGNLTIGNNHDRFHSTLYLDPSFGPVWKGEVATGLQITSGGGSGVALRIRHTADSNGQVDMTFIPDNDATRGSFFRVFPASSSRPGLHFGASVSERGLLPMDDNAELLGCLSTDALCPATKRWAKIEAVDMGSGDYCFGNDMCFTECVDDYGDSDICIVEGKKTEEQRRRMGLAIYKDFEEYQTSHSTDIDEKGEALGFTHYDESLTLEEFNKLREGIIVGGKLDFRFNRTVLSSINRIRDVEEGLDNLITILITLGTVTGGSLIYKRYRTK